MNKHSLHLNSIKMHFFCSSLLILFSSMVGRASSLTRNIKGRQTTELKTAFASSSSCQKYVVLTTQRSGSTWACNLLDLQKDITCGGTEIYGGIVRVPELLIQYSSKTSEERKEIQWTEYEKDFTEAMQNAIDANSACASPSLSSSTDSAAAGFKLMYDQIPSKFIQSGEIFDYFAKNNIAVIHLVREAKILRIASMKESHAMGGQPHSVDQSYVKQFRDKTQPLSWDETMIKKIPMEEKKDASWEISLSFKPNLKYHRLSYEKMLLEEDLISQLNQIFVFLKTTQKYSSVNLDSKLLKLQKSTCRARIMNYEEFRKHISGTRTAAACDMLDDLYDDEQEVEM